MPHVAEYDLRVSRLYPQKCDDRLPFAGVPTEELGRRAQINRTSGKAKLAIPGSEGVKAIFANPEGQEPSSLELLGTCKRRAPAASSGLWIGADDRNDQCLSQAERIRTGRRMPFMRGCHVPDMLVANRGDRSWHANEDRKQRARPRDRLDLASGFSDIHSLYPVSQRNQETTDSKPRGIARVTRPPSDVDAGHNVFSYPLPKRRDLMYTGCIERTVGLDMVRRSHLTAAEGFLGPSAKDDEVSFVRRNASANKNEATQAHLSGGAVPIDLHSDSFESQRKLKRQPLLMDNLQQLTAAGQNLEKDDPNELAKSISGCARRMIPQKHIPDPRETRTRSRRSCNAALAHTDHIWEIDRGWAHDQWRIPHGIPRDDWDSWQQIRDWECDHEAQYPHEQRYESDFGTRGRTMESGWHSEVKTENSPSRAERQRDSEHTKTFIPDCCTGAPGNRTQLQKSVEFNDEPEGESPRFGAEYTDAHHPEILSSEPNVQLLREAEELPDDEGSQDDQSSDSFRAIGFKVGGEPIPPLPLKRQSEGVMEPIPVPPEGLDAAPHAMPRANAPQEGHPVASNASVSKAEKPSGDKNGEIDPTATDQAVFDQAGPTLKLHHIRLTQGGN